MNIISALKIDTADSLGQMMTIAHGNSWVSYICNPGTGSLTSLSRSSTQGPIGLTQTKYPPLVPSPTARPWHRGGMGVILVSPQCPKVDEVGKTISEIRGQGEKNTIGIHCIGIILLQKMFEIFP